MHMVHSHLRLEPKGDLNHRKLTYDCAAPASTPFDIAIGPMASSAGAPKICSMRTIKSDVVVGLESDELAEHLDKNEAGWRISGKYVSLLRRSLAPAHLMLMDLAQAVVLLSDGRPGEKVKFA
jgi:damage-control phosphatase, subfamily III